MADQDWQARLKTGRNDDCPCGSKKKYKKCHLQADEQAQSAALAKANAEAAEKAKAEADGHEGHGTDEHHGHSGHEHHGHHGHSHGGGHTPKPGSPVVRQVSAPRKAGGGS